MSSPPLDATILIGMHHDEDEFRDQVVDHFDVLYEESAKQGGRIHSGKRESGREG